MTPALSKGDKENQEELNAIYSRIFGKKQQSLPLEINTELRINGKPSGKITAYTDTKKIIKIQASILRNKLQRYLKTSLMNELEKTMHDKQWFTSEQLKMVGISLGYNMMQLVIDIDINKKSLNRRMRSMLSALPGQYSVVPENLLTPADLSGYVNLVANVSYQPDVSSNKVGLNLRAESAVNIQGFVFENQLSFAVGQYNDVPMLRREHSRLVLDDPENDYRYKIGDINILGRNFQRHFTLGGIQLSKEKIWSDSHEYLPQGNFSFTLENNAKVSVYQDGKFNRTYPLKAGRYRLSDLGVNRGNHVKLKIKDSFGNERSEYFDRFAVGNRLKPDYSQYAFSLGVPSQRVNNKIEYKTNSPIFSGYYQQGVTENLTAGIDFQTNTKSHHLGIDAIWTTKLGGINIGMVQSKTTDHRLGQAIRFQIGNPRYRFSQWENNNTKKISKTDWNFSINHYSKDYQALTAVESGDMVLVEAKTKEQFNVSIIHNFSSTAMASLNISQTKKYNGKDELYLQASIRRPFNRYIDLSVFATYSKNDEGISDNKINFNLGLNYPLEKTNAGRDQSLTSSYHSINNSSQINYKLGSKGRLGTDSISTSLSLSSRNQYKALNANMYYKDNQYDANAQYNINGNKKMTQKITGNLHTAFVFADDHVALSRPIYDSFAILTDPKGLQYPMAVSRGKNLFERHSNDLKILPKHYDALIKPDKKTVLPNISSYRVQHISVDSAVLPDGFNIDATEFDLMPDYKSAYLIKVGGEKGTDFTATLLNETGKPVVLLGGQLVPQGDLQDAPVTLFFSDELGQISISGIKKGRYLIDLFTTDSKKIIIKTNSGVEIKDNMLCVDHSCYF
jgi:outer membrane usher protein